ncbi:MAG: carboxypeptidase-like regulatory domain-containing protein [Thermoanaerobaculia bacterium]
MRASAVLLEKRGHASRWLERVLLLVAFFALLTGSVATASPQSGFVQRPETDLLLMAVRLGNDTLADTLPAYSEKGGGIVVPLGQVAQLLSFAIDVDVTTGRASGFIINETRRFDLDVGAGTISINGKEQTFDRSRVEIHQDDIYVDTALLSKWLPVDLDVDLYASMITVKPREPLPSQIKEQRAQAMERTLASLGYRGQPLPLHPTPYSLLDGPFIDQSLRLRSSSGQSQSMQFTSLITGAFLDHDASLFLSGTNRDPFADTRGTLGRSDPRGTLLGPLRAREYAAGEIFSPGDPLLFAGSSGPGVLLSNYPLERQNQFDRHSFRGELLPGWDVELYRNDALVGYQQSRPDGLYEFIDVPLLFGVNVFRLVFHGPQGQVEERDTRFNVGDSLTPPGELYYRLAAEDARIGGHRGILQADYGLTRQISTGFAVARARLDDGSDRSYGKASLSGFWKTLFAQGALAVDSKGGSATTAILQSRIQSVNLILEHTELSGFESEVFRPLFGEIRRRSRLRLDAFPALGGVSFPVSFELQRDGLATGGSIYRLSNGLSSRFRRLYVSNRVVSVFPAGTAALQDAQTDGSLLLSQSLRGSSIRGEATYHIDPRRRLDTISLTSDLLQIPDYVLQFGVRRMVGARENQYLMNVNRIRGPVAIGVDTQWSKATGFEVSLNLFAGILRDGRSGAWLVRRQGSAAFGAVSALVFLDRNGNGHMDPGEEPIPGAGFFVDDTSSPWTTGPDGRAVIPGLTTVREHDIRLSPSTLEDLLWVPKVKGVRLVPHAGTTTLVEFPVMVTGEITGTVRITQNGTTREAPGVALDLVDAAGNVAFTVRTAYDGFFDFTKVEPGEYHLRASETQRGIWKNAVLPKPKAITIGRDGTIVDGADLTLELP